MNNIQLLILTITVITILAILIILWRKGLLKTHKKKILSILVTSSILSGSVILMFTGNIIVEPSAGNTVYSVWFKSSPYNMYVTTNTSVPFSRIQVDEDYVYLNTTLFMSDPVERLNITVMFINSSGVTPGVGDLCLSFYSNVTGAENIVYTIGGLEALTTYNIEKNNTPMTTEISTPTGFITFTNNFASEDYFIKLDIYKGSSDSSTVRKQGVDYFVWLGINTSACYVKNNITGMDEAIEYVAILAHTGLWSLFYGDNTGTNWTVHTFDVIRTYLADGPGTVTFTITHNPSIDFNAGRTVTLAKIGNGYNYTGYTNTTISTTTSGINTTLALAHGYFCALWNQTTYIWDYWISGHGITSKYVTHYNVIVTKINVDKSWTM